MTTIKEQLTTLISDPFDGPFEGADYYVENDILHVVENNVRLAGVIAHTVNHSGLFEKKLVRLGVCGDTIMLGFDSLGNAGSVFTTKIGKTKDILVEVKATEDNRFCFYLNKHRSGKQFKTLISTKRYLTKLDKELKREDSRDIDHREEDEEDELVIL